MVFKKNYIYEVIIEIDTDNGKNFAPFGIKYLGTKDGIKKFEINVFKGTNTARLLTKNLNKNLFKCIWTSDIKCFYECVTKKFSKEFINKIEKFPMVVFEVESIEDMGDRFRVISFPKYMEKGIERKIKKNLLNRAEHLTLESLIYYTKPINDNVKKEKISEMLRTIRKVAPGSKYEHIVSNLLMNVK